MNKNTTTRIAISGATGRMGRMLIEAVLSDPHTRLSAALDIASSPAIGRDAAEFMGQPSGIKITHDAQQALNQTDVLIDFTRPEGTLELLKACTAHGVRAVIGTTGFDAQGLEAIRGFSQQQAAVFAPNMSVGVNITLKLLEIAGQYLSEGFDIEVIEAHHRHKVDAPSGTALKMGEVVAKAAGRNFKQDARFAREGHTGERTAQEIGFSVIRGGDIVGDHTVLFAGTGERIEITHKSSSRATYAQGALRAAKFLMGQPSGLFDMQDVLGLRR
ncbi:MAG: 4-hydroxy-tetrahydrodipicolinate reductase [Burkholderiaceae bacterium]|nr:4-hydroxy-tetrahydrodipicolinate reductase [Burkholderiaceae bacterium]